MKKVLLVVLSVVAIFSSPIAAYGAAAAEETVQNSKTQYDYLNAMNEHEKDFFKDYQLARQSIEGLDLRGDRMPPMTRASVNITTNVTWCTGTGCPTGSVACPTTAIDGLSVYGNGCLTMYGCHVTVNGDIAVTGNGRLYAYRNNFGMLPINPRFDVSGNVRMSSMVNTEAPLFCANNATIKFSSSTGTVMVGDNGNLALTDSILQGDGVTWQGIWGYNVETTTAGIYIDIDGSTIRDALYGLNVAYYNTATQDYDYVKVEHLEVSDTTLRDLTTGISLYRPDNDNSMDFQVYFDDVSYQDLYAWDGGELHVYDSDDLSSSGKTTYGMRVFFERDLVTIGGNTSAQGNTFQNIINNPVLLYGNSSQGFDIRYNSFSGLATTQPENFDYVISVIANVGFATSRISNNTISNVYYYNGIKFGGAGNYTANNLQIKDNTISNFCQDYQDAQSNNDCAQSGAGIDVMGSSDTYTVYNPQIQGNHVSYGKRDGLRLVNVSGYNSTSNISYWLIYSNIFDHMYYLEGTEYKGIGVFFGDNVSIGLKYNNSSDNMNNFHYSGKVGSNPPLLRNNNMCNQGDYDVDNQGTVTVEALYNYWGSSVNVSTSVTYMPYLITPSASAPACN